MYLRTAGCHGACTRACTRRQVAGYMWLMIRPFPGTTLHCKRAKVCGLCCSILSCGTSSALHTRRLSRVSRRDAWLAELKTVRPLHCAQVYTVCSGSATCCVPWLVCAYESCLLHMLGSSAGTAAVVEFVVYMLVFCPDGWFFWFVSSQAMLQYRISRSG
jgi:hypothetical protein